MVRAVLLPLLASLGNALEAAMWALGAIGGLKDVLQAPSGCQSCEMHKSGML